MLYCNENEMEINEVILEDNELASVELISGQSHANKNEMEIGEITSHMANANDPQESEPEFLSAAEAMRLQSVEEDLDMRPYLYDGNSKKHTGNL